MALKSTLKKPSGKGAPPASPSEALSGSATTEKAAGTAWAALNFSVTPDVKKDLKMIAAMHDKTMTEVFKESLELYKKAHGIS